MGLPRGRRNPAKSFSFSRRQREVSAAAPGAMVRLDGSAEAVQLRRFSLMAFGACTWATLLSSCQFPDYQLGDPATGGSPSTELCEQPDRCVPEAPAGWRGPVAFWQGASTTEPPPECPEGYDSPTDAHARPSASDADCTCRCDAVEQTCDDEPALVVLFQDLACETVCTLASPLECIEVAGCNGSAGTMRAAAAQPTGACSATVEKNTTPPSWQRDARLCELSRPTRDDCADANQACAPTPGSPFSSQSCVYRVVLEGETMPSCPPSHARATAMLYSSLSDDRDCGECTCDGPTGGSCEGTVLLSSGDDCSSASEYSVGSGCQPFSLPRSPTSIAADYVLTPGSCAVASQPEPTGSVTPAGNALVVCCHEET